MGNAIFSDRKWVLLFSDISCYTKINLDELKVHIMAYEIEIKVRLENMDTIINKLAQKGCVWISQNRQYDKIYSQKNKNINSEVIFMRIRHENNEDILNLKQIVDSTEVVEFESFIGSPDEIEKMINLIGFEEYITVDKIRLKGRLNDISICVDDVKRLGFFLEIEKIVKSKDECDRTKIMLQNLLISLGIGLEQICNKRYHTMLYELKQKKEE